MSLSDNTEVFRSFAVSRGKERESKFLDLLKSAGKPMPQREVYRALSISARELQAIAQPLARLGLIREGKTRTKSGRYITTYEAI